MEEVITGRLAEVPAIIARAQDLLADILGKYLPANGGILQQRHYARYLSMQYHVTKGVQRYFLGAAAHEDLARRKPLRAFLTNFANEEELHFKLAERDLAALGDVLVPISFDMELWHAYFTKITPERPFVRVGAACVLENITTGSVRPHLRQLLASPYMNKANTTFIVLHQHETLPHGDQILDALAHGNLESSHYDDLVEGARKGAMMLLRLLVWCLETDGTERAIFADAER